MIEPGDDALVLAESLGTLAPLKIDKRAFELDREIGDRGCAGDGARRRLTRAHDMRLIRA